MNLQEKYYDYIKNGTKRIELRLYDEKRKKTKVGDIIEFNKGHERKEKLKVKVINLLHYKTFEELINDYDISIMCDRKEKKEKLLEDLQNYYSIDEQKKYGVVGIVFELLPKVLTIKEPWASLIINGHKEYEFRSWKTNYRGKILIHAGISVDKNIDKFKTYNFDYGKGEIIGEATLVDCIKVDKNFEEKLKEKDSLVYGSSNYNRNYAFHLINVIKYKKRVKCKGKLGIWNYEGE